MRPVTSSPCRRSSTMPRHVSLLWKERSIRRILAIQAKADLALFSVGAVGADVPSQVHVGGYLSPAELGRLHRAGVVGDIATVFYRSDGSTSGSSSTPGRAVHRSPTSGAIPNRLCVAVGGGKAEALAAALEGGYITHLLADQRAARRGRPDHGLDFVVRSAEPADSRPRLRPAASRMRLPRRRPDRRADQRVVRVDRAASAAAGSRPS